MSQARINLKPPDAKYSGIIAIAMDSKDDCWELNGSYSRTDISKVPMIPEDRISYAHHFMGAVIRSTLNRLLRGIPLNISQEEKNTLSTIKKTILETVQCLTAGFPGNKATECASYSEELEKFSGKLIKFDDDTFKKFILPLLRLNYFDAAYDEVRVDREAEKQFLFWHAALRSRWNQVLMEKGILNEAICQNINIGETLSDLKSKCEISFAIEKTYRTILLITHDKMLRAIVIPRLNNKLDNKKPQSFRMERMNDGKRQRENKRNEQNESGQQKGKEQQIEQNEVGDASQEQ